MHRKKKGKCEANLKNLPVEVIPHTIPEAKLQEIFSFVGWNQFPDEVYKRVRVQPAVYTVEEHHVSVYGGKDNLMIVFSGQKNSSITAFWRLPSLQAS